jgi:hypothetical protein
MIGNVSITIRITISYVWLICNIYILLLINERKVHVMLCVHVQFHVSVMGEHNYYDVQFL